MEEICEEELKESLHNFQKDKIPGPGGWPIEFFLAFYESIGLGLLQLVKESRKGGIMDPPINDSFP